VAPTTLEIGKIGEHKIHHILRRMISPVLIFLPFSFLLMMKQFLHTP
jgi:hypothetical protein